ncbi:hypothetical protein ROZALSC1DRAFT_25564 [Rozella allomycis CSF55]|uniref:Uncharacterized protein n=1 Tax=Rozella allomycis (strain CSF55) TaxID=988480 RepID=A0A4P9YAP6_ROZAC|nr:hypothetical protein ROZALSC1DRAFT_25564 [Rozella allomycis CSF55]
MSQSQSNEPETVQDNELTNETQESDQDSASTIDKNISIENKKSSSILDSFVAEDSDSGGNSGIVVGSIAAGLGLLGAGSTAVPPQPEMSQSQSNEPEIAQDHELTNETQETDQDSASTIDKNISIENRKSSSILDSLVAEDSDNGGNSGIIVGSIAAGLGLLGVGSFAYKKRKKAI